MAGFLVIPPNGTLSGYGIKAYQQLAPTMLGAILNLRQGYGWMASFTVNNELDKKRMISIRNENKQVVAWRVFPFLFAVTVFPKTAHATEVDVLDFFVYWPFTIIIGLLINFSLKCLLTKFTGKMELLRIITFEIIILFLAFIISGTLRQGWVLTVGLYYPFAYLVNILELKIREKQDIHFAPSFKNKARFSVFSSATLLVSVAITKWIHLVFH